MHSSPRSRSGVTVPAIQVCRRGWRRYRAALQEVLDPALEHLRDAEANETILSILAVIAHAKGQRTLATIALRTENERQEALGEL
jgi:hypothetical protein